MRRSHPLFAAVLAIAAATGCDGDLGGDADPPAPPDAPPSPIGAGACEVPAVEIDHGPGSPGVATMHLLDLARHPAARCNDGTPGSYRRRAGFGAGARRWMIYLEGGGSCEVAADCAARYANSRGLMSSAGVVDGAVEPRPLGGGIKSTSAAVNPDFHDVNLVQLDYCSSDGWSGERAATDAPIDELGHWHFAGRAIVRAVVSELLADGLDAGDEVLLLGSSAGGVGVVNNADDVRQMLPAGVRLVAIADAGYSLDYPAYDVDTRRESSALPTPGQVRLAQADAAWGGRGDASCVAAATTEVERARCRASGAVLTAGEVSTPVLMRQSQLDPVALGRLIPASVIRERGGPVDAYRGRYAAAMRAQLAASPPPTSVFSTFDTEHGVVNNDAEWAAQAIGGTSLRDAVGAFYRAPCSPALRIATP